MNAAVATTWRSIPSDIAASGFELHPAVTLDVPGLTWSDVTGTPGHSVADSKSVVIYMMDLTPEQIAAILALSAQSSSSSSASSGTPSTTRRLLLLWRDDQQPDRDLAASEWLAWKDYLREHGFSPARLAQLGDLSRFTRRRAAQALADYLRDHA
jgi:hypothetical protein